MTIGGPHFHDAIAQPAKGALYPLRTGAVPANLPYANGQPSLLSIPYTSACGTCHTGEAGTGW